ncbi:MAG: hypothetical protein ACI9WU_002173 [Myxococcota bacterium]
MTSKGLTAAQRVRYIMYAVGVTVAILVVLDGVFGWMDSSGTVGPQRADDSHALQEDPWVERGGFLIPNPALSSAMPQHQLSVRRGDAYRLIMAGGSFFKGVPYQHEGTIHHALEALLKEGARRAIEVANGSMSAMASGVVGQVVGYAVTHQPSVLVVASCNNEGTLPPSQVTERLHKLGTVRVLRRLLRDDTDGDSTRPVHTPQDPDVDAIRANFRKNLEAMATSAAEAEVPLLLCTLPVNLLYRGEEAGLPIEGHRWEEQGTVPYSACIQKGIALHDARRYPEAISQLERCDEVEALRWIGLARYASGQMDAARRALEAYTELVPRNRCRPSFNTVIRQIAQRHPHVHLVDLDAEARKISYGGLAGGELFEDYCHMNREAQGKVAGWIFARLSELGLAGR